MEEEDDDLYGTGPANGNAPAQHANGQPAGGDDKVDEDLESGEEEESEDSESDIEIVTEKTDVPEVSIPSRFAKPDAASGDAAALKPAEGETKRKASSAIQIVDPATKTRQPTNQPILFPGNQYPGIHSSTIDVKNIPLWNGKPITEIDIDSDLAEQAKPWRRPGADQSDYFNYGFDEFTWSTYIMKQKTMADTLADQKAEAKQFETSLLSMGIPMPPGMPSMPTMPGMPNPSGNANGPPTGPSAGMPSMPSMPSMPGMPAEADMYAAFMQAVASGQDPNQMDFGAFMQQSGMAGQMGGVQQPGGGGGGQGMGAVPTGPSAGQQGQWGQNQGYGQQGGQQQGGRGRRGGRW